MVEASLMNSGSSGSPGDARVLPGEICCAVSSYYGWRRKLNNGAAVPKFIARRVVEERGGRGDPKLGEREPGSRSAGVRIELAGGRQVLVRRGFDRRLLLEVIEVLEQAAGVSGAAS